MNARKRRRLQYRGTMNTKIRNENHGIDTFTGSSFIQLNSFPLAPSFLGMFRVVWYAVSVSNNFPDRNLNTLRNRLFRVIFRMIFGLVCVHTVHVCVRIFIRKCLILMRGRIRQARVLSNVSAPYFRRSPSRRIRSLFRVNSRKWRGVLLSFLYLLPPHVSQHTEGTRVNKLRIAPKISIKHPFEVSIVVTVWS